MLVAKAMTAFSTPVVLKRVRSIMCTQEEHVIPSIWGRGRRREERKEGGKGGEGKGEEREGGKRGKGGGEGRREEREGGR